MCSGLRALTALEPHLHTDRVAVDMGASERYLPQHRIEFLQPVSAPDQHKAESKKRNDPA